MVLPSYLDPEGTRRLLSEAAFLRKLCGYIALLAAGEGLFGSHPVGQLVLAYSWWLDGRHQ